MTNPEAAYPNSSSSPCSSTTTLLLTLALFVLSLSSGSIQTVDSESQGSREVEWQILTKLNFSSQIRLHPHILLLVTVPWSGESRTLMKELAHIVNNKQEKFGTLKLMLVYKSSDKILADALGATEGITVLYYHQSLSYKYQGPLRVQNILSSVHHVMKLMPEDIPLKSINTPENLKSFIESTDKALLLLEFCGWTPRLLANGKNNGTESEFEGILGTGFNLETNGTFTAEGKKNQKKMESEKMNCGIDSGSSANPWPGEFSPINGSDFLDSENGVSCSFDEFQRFEAFLPKLMTVVKEFFLPPERLRFGLVRERSLLSFLGVQDSDPWLMMLYFAGCPSCSKVLKEGVDIKSALQMQASPVLELKGDDNNLEPALPADKPSILLFIDRSSELLEIRKKSDEALGAFRELALYHRMNEQTTAKSQKSSLGTNQSPTSTFGHPKLEMSPVSQKITTLKDKASVMIMDNGKHVAIDKIASDLQGNSLREILTFLLQHRKEIKISSLAKDVGFELLSNDFAIKIAEDLPSEVKVQSNQVSAKLPIEDLKGSGHFSENQTPDMAGGTDEELSKSADAELSPDEVKNTFHDSSNQLSVGPDPHFIDEVVASAADGKSEKTLPDFEPGEHQLHFPGFRGSFFFSDGQWRLLKALVHVSKIPMVVIIDPLSQQHYVLAEEEVISYCSLSDFLDSFLNGSLLPYRYSESVIQSPTEAPRPPFVNQDFHEVDSIPRVTTHTFLELVVGNQSDLTDAGNAWKKDVLVLFSNNWCGFCQRMELVVREVHLAFKGYVRMLKDGIREEKFSLTTDDDMKNSNLKLPLIYLMDCTLNDCSLILKSYTQRELYPSLLLFPAERKKAVPYGGDMAVSEIIDFIADRGSNSQRFFRENGILWTKASRGIRDDNLHKDASQVADDEELTSAKDKYHEVLLKDRGQRIKVRDNQIRPLRLNGSHETSPQMVAGSILVATDKLLNLNPFDGSKILIVNVNRSTGFQGLIINKHISWDSLGKLDEGLELLKVARLSLGGPVILREMPLIALTRKFVKDHCVGVLPDVYFLDQWATLNIIEGLKVGNYTISDYWFFLGYSSWDWDQLFDEIADGSWKISNGDAEQLNWPWG